MERNTIRQWAISEGVYPRTAQFAAERLGIKGEKIATGYYISRTDWEKIKANLRQFNTVSK